MGVEWQVVGQQIDIVRQQQRQALLEPTGHAAVMAAPEQTMVNQQSIRTLRDRRFDQSATRCHPRYDFLNL